MDQVSTRLWGGSKGVVNFPWIFWCSAEFSPCWALLGYIWALIHLAYCGSFHWRHGLLFTDCVMWDDNDKMIGFKASYLIYWGWWSTESPMLQLFQLPQYSQVTSCRLISSSAYFPWNVILKYKMQLSEGSWDKILHSKSRTQCFLKEEKNFLAVCLSKWYTKFPEVVFAISL